FDQYLQLLRLSGGSRPTTRSRRDGDQAYPEGQEGREAVSCLHHLPAIVWDYSKKTQHEGRLVFGGTRVASSCPGGMPPQRIRDKRGAQGTYAIREHCVEDR
ncbi:unnamed protein product, partial [Ectocarpus sp. 13 AM-2016]